MLHRRDHRPSLIRSSLRDSRLRGTLPRDRARRKGDERDRSEVEDKMLDSLLVSAADDGERKRDTTRELVPLCVGFFDEQK